MDMFGIGHGVNSVLQAYFFGGRRSGRTTRLLESLKTGDRVVFASHEEARRFKRLCVERSIDVECVVWSPCSPRLPEVLGGKYAPTKFDHSWIEQFYVGAVRNAAKDIQGLEVQLSRE